MSVTASGICFIAYEKMMINSAALSFEVETNKLALVTDSHTPNFDTDATWTNTNETAGGSWSAGGIALTGTEITTSAGTAKFDATDMSQATSTVSAAMAGRLYAAAVSDEELLVVDFIAAVTTVSGTLTITWNASGIYTNDLTP
jgi:hypothetical protein|tara:strand:+ start:114 stop:545 length:432 start_codon:yes stop_codon:yes gene_type:complete